jgi:hypothetical protein
MRKAYSALRRGNFRKALRELSVDPKRKHKNKIRNAADEASGLWLEYWFGWSPSVNDIFTALEQLESDIPNSRFSGTARVRFNKTTGPIFGGVQQQTATVRIKTGATVRCTNPNLFLASQLGIVNPAAIAWEVIPFSFLVDWIFKVGDFINSFSDFAGCALENPYRTSVLNFYDLYEQRNNSSEPRNVWSVTSATGAAMVRHVGVIRPIPNRQVFANLGTSLTRTATAVSLLHQVLSGSDLLDRRV